MARADFNDLVVGTVSYNEFTFPAPIRLKVQITPDWDRAGRVIKYRTYNVTIETEILPQDLGLNAGDPIDYPMQTLRRQLLTEGADLYLKNQGLGEDIFVHAGNVVGFGPKPQMLVWEPIGSNLACRIVWQCTFTIAQCTEQFSSIQAFQLAEFSYGMQISLTSEGLITRTISGIAEVLVGRSGKGIQFTADLVRDTLFIPHIKGFKRDQTYNLSDDKRFLDFTITDTEINSENPYQPNMVSMDVTHRVSGSLLAGVDWSCSLSGSIQVAPGINRSLAWKAFLVIVKDRVLDLKKQLKKENGVIILQQFEISEEIYGRSVSFSLSWRLVTSVYNLFKHTNLFKPVSGATAEGNPDLGWNAWHGTIVAQKIRSPRGISDVRHVAGDDRLINVCQKASPGFEYRDIKRELGEEEIENLFEQDLPSKEDSWLVYQHRTQVIRNTSIMRQRILGGRDSESAGYITTASAFRVTMENVPSTSPIITQETGGSMAILYLYGYAERVGHDILDKDLPFPESIGGERAILIWQKTRPSHQIKVSLEGFPIFRASWQRAYHMQRADAEIIINIKSEVKTLRFFVQPGAKPGKFPQL